MVRLNPRFEPLGVGTNPFGGAVVGDRVKVGFGEFLAKPPAGTYWHRPQWSDTFTLHAHQLQPILEIGDVIGIRPGDRIVRPPIGCHLIPIPDASVPLAKKGEAAQLFRVVGPPSVPAIVDIPRSPLKGAVAIDRRFPTNLPTDKRWFPFLVDGRNLQRVFAVPLAA